MVAKKKKIHESFILFRYHFQVFCSGVKCELFVIR